MRQEKILHTQAIKADVEENPTLLLLRYLSLKANGSNALRTGLSQIGAKLEVVPKRLLKKVASQVELSLDAFDLSGHIGIVVGTGDPIELAKSVKEFSKANGDVLELVGGRVEGDLLNGSQVEQLTKLPGKQEMQAQFLATLAAPMSEMVGVLNALLVSVPNCLEAKSKK